jgi:hypothetical protein
MALYGKDESEAKVYRVVVVRQARCCVSTTLRRFEEAAAKAGVILPAEYGSRAEAEDALAAIEEHAEDIVTRVEYSDKERTF